MPDYSLAKWRKIMKVFNSKYEGLINWQTRNIQIAQTQGYVRNPSGRVLTFDTVNRFGVTTVDEKQVKNYPVQSASSDIMYLFMVRVLDKLNELGVTADLILQVHDSMVFDCPLSEAETLVRAVSDMFKQIPAMAKDYFGWDIVVPLDGDCEIGYSYGSTVEVPKSDFDIVFKDLQAWLNLNQ